MYKPEYFSLQPRKGHFLLQSHNHQHYQDENGDVKKSFSDTRYVVESIARNIDSINQNMNGAARNLNEFTRQIRNNPGLLLGGSAPVLKEEN